jgi:ATP-dependent phosphofructokinase / diphosphate-dependent phosphofructokinase
MAERVGILVGGGPAPGINSALSSAVIEAIKAGAEVTGIYDGFEHLIKGRTDMVRPLSIPDVSRIHFQGGSIIRTSRANPAKSAADMERTVAALHELGISHLITIGGEDTGSSAGRIAAATKGQLRVAHIPKTIDNDLPLPANAPTFGFETARHLGTQWVLNLMEESRTTNRWCLVIVMGRKAGHLALGVGKAAGATITVIPEEFAAEQITFGDLCRVLEGAILKRRSLGRQDGIAVIAEGVATKMDPADLARVGGAEVGYDAHGNIRLEKIPLTTILEREMTRRFAERGESLPLVTVSLGYELRCAAPIPFDIDYTRTLGYGAVRFLLGEDGGGDGLAGGLVCLEDGRLRVLPFEELQEPGTGRIPTRMVDINSESYMVAREYMIRLQRSDLDDPASLARIAEAAGMGAEEFAQRFRPAVELDAGQPRQHARQA